MPKKILYITGGIFVFLIVTFVIASKLPSQPVVTKSETAQENTSQLDQSDTAIKQPSVTVRENNSVTVTPTPGSKVNAITPTPKSSECKIVNHLPDPNCTPGAIDPRVTQDNIQSTICVSGYTATVRPSTSVTSKIKTERMAAYGDTDSPSYYELDHLISLELGGSPASVLNLFPEPYANQLGAREKDRVENYLHKEVCNGTITLDLAQKEIATNWVKVYVTAGFAESTSGSTANTTNTFSIQQNTDSQTTTGVVKMSTTGICHAPGTTYYDRTTNFTPYNSIADCLAAGGRLPAK